VGLAGAGVIYLLCTTNPMTAWLAAATVCIYLFVYTPLKRKTAFCTVAGAISGAIPPVIGWTAAQGRHPELGLGAWILFGVLFLWQMPHFLAIAWLYRDEYAQAGFVMLKRDDVTGTITALTSLLFSFALLVITLIPFFAGVNNWVYLFGALALDVGLLFVAVQFTLDRTKTTARRLFFASILFPPLLLGLMVFTRS
jgi:protoheme IX farnesyltransferase